MDAVADSPALLFADEPPALEEIAPLADIPLLLVCDHAANRLPRALNGLGIAPQHLQDHIAWDIGAADVTRKVAACLGAGALLGGYSRLVLDLNRSPDDPTAIPLSSDGIAIPGNQALTSAQKQARVDGLFLPYHQAIRAALIRLGRLGPPPVLFSIHSFTPQMNGQPRPWHVGVLWNQDPRMAQALLQTLREENGLIVGDNEPYSGREIAYTLNAHAGAAGLPHAAVEIRQDLIQDKAGVEEWAERLCRLLPLILARPGLLAVKHFL